MPAAPAPGLPALAARGLALAGVAALAGLLGGCAQGPAPASGTAAGSAGVARPATPDGPRARLLLRGAVPADDRFAVVELTDSAQCQGPRVLSSGDARQTPAPASVAAGVMTTLDFVVLRAGKAQCGVRWSFIPEAGKTYLAHGMVVGSSCTARLMDATIADQPPRPVPGLLLRTAPGQACLALDKSRPAATADSLIQGGQRDGEAVLYPQATPRDLQGLIRP